MKRAPIKQSKILPRKTPMRRHARPSMTPARRSAKGQDCTLCFPGCTNDRETVVLCHLRMFGGGGTGIKPDDSESCYACRYCHDVCDGRIPWVTINSDTSFNFWEHIARAIVRTQRVMRANGVLIFKGEEAA